MRENVEVRRVERRGNRIAVVVAAGDGAESVVEASHLLVAAGRRPNVEGLNLEAAGIEAGPKGVTTDASLKTTNRKVWAVGDVAGRWQFTHIAGLPRERRHPAGAVPDARQGRRPGGAVGHLHRPGAGAGRPHRRRRRGRRR